jgi:hypothetical protein
MEDDDQQRQVRQQLGERPFEEAGDPTTWEEASPRTRGTVSPRLRPAVSSMRSVR